jgi:hypothetical protein
MINVNPELFIVKNTEFPSVPIEFSEESRLWWMEQKKRCIEGYTQGGRWMPPNLYFYINFWNIRQNKKEKSKTKILDRPKLRDIEWEVLTAWSLARGLSGFSNIGDIPKELVSVESKINWLWNLPTNDPGYPLYDNNAKDLLLMSSRETGKSMIMAGAIVAHEWLFNGHKRYLLKTDKDYEELSTTIVVGAGDTKYSNIIVSNFKDGYDYLAQKGIEFGGMYYPHPFLQQYDGSFQPGKSITAKYQKNVGGKWMECGSKSMIRHVTYKNNSFAGQGTRNSVMVKDEIGMFENLMEARDNDIETMMSGTNKFGSCFFAGTGGDMDKGTVDAYKMFYNPDAYDILAFEDKWENKGKICMFIPVTKRAMVFKDEYGNTDEHAALEHYKNERILKKKGSRKSFNQYIQYNPIVPSEMFLRTVGNIFPIKEVVDVLTSLETTEVFSYAVDLIEKPSGEIDWVPNTNLQPIVEYPLDSKDDKEGCVVLYEPPKYDLNDGTEISFGRYIAATDPINHVSSETSESLASTFILDTWTDKLVAEYTARPSGDKTYFSNVRKLLKLYNARVLYENMFKGMYDYFDYMNELYLLCDQPSYIKDVIPNSKVERGKGMHMNEELRAHGERKFYDWLTTKTGNSSEPNRMNLHNIKSIPLLKEIIMYDGGNKVNTDRVDACLLLMFQLRERAKLRDSEIKNSLSGYVPPHKSKFFETPLFQRSFNVLNKY